MSDLSYSQIGILVRNRLDLPASARLRLQSLINTGLQRLGKKVAQDRHKRQYILSDQSTTTATLASGSVSLDTLIDDSGLQLEFITYGFLWHSDYTAPLQWKRGPDMGAIAGPFDNVFPHCWMEGTTLYAKGTNGAALSGVVRFAVPYVPTLAQLSNTLNDELLDTLVGLVQEAPNDYYETPGTPE